MRSICLFFSFFFLVFILRAQVKDTPTWDQPQSYKPMVSQAKLMGSIPALRSLKPYEPLEDSGPKTWSKKNYFKENKDRNPAPLPKGFDPLLEFENTQTRGLKQVQGAFEIDGIGSKNNVYPPDPTGDIGKDHYMQMVNYWGGSEFQIWNKKGQTVYGPANSNTLWAQVGLKGYGDPIIQYDHEAQRWIMLELSQIFVNELLIAISDDSDPTGSWKAYSISTYGFPDYPKFYVWHDAYYLSVNEIDPGNICTGYALDRKAMLNGDPGIKVYRFKMPTFQGIQFQPPTGVDWEGGPPPPPGSPGYIMRLYDDKWGTDYDHLEIWKVFLNWEDENQSSLQGPEMLYPAPFESSMCCVPEPPTGDGYTPSLGTVNQIIMYRAPYRNFGDHESIVLNYVVDVTGSPELAGVAGLRWYELRRWGNSPWTIYQQGTYSPDAQTGRFMGTISLDDKGNIGLGYSVSDSISVYPGLRVTGRLASDPLGQMTFDEHVVGEGHHSNMYGRWGDYSSMAVDPIDGRTFWFTGEYQPDTTLWGTKIGAFSLYRDANDLMPAALKLPVSSTNLGNAEAVQVEILNNGMAETNTATASLYVDGNLITTDTISTLIAPGSSYFHTFSVPVSLETVEKNYQFMVITQLQEDAFVKNDTLRSNVQHLTTNNAQLTAASFPDVMCGTDYHIPLILRNAGGAPLQSVKIHWKMNNQSYAEYDWTGNLAPNKYDTVYLASNGFINGTNYFSAFTELPNNQADQHVENDSLVISFGAKLEGSFITAEVKGGYGILVMELRDMADQLIVKQEFGVNKLIRIPICTDIDSCYKVHLRSKNYNWSGTFRLLDIYGNTLTETTYALEDPTEQTLSFCVPSQKSRDVGAMELLSPRSSPTLGAAEPVKIRYRNFGTTAQSDIELSYRVDGGPWHTETVPGPLPILNDAEHVFATTEDLSTFGNAYHFEFRATVPGDEKPANDGKQADVLHRTKLDFALLAAEPGYNCSDTDFITLYLTVANEGQNDIYEAYMEYTVDGAKRPFAYLDPNTIIHSGETAKIPFKVNSLHFGSNDIKIWFREVNFSLHDNNQNNDTLRYTLDIDSTGLGIYCALLTDSKPEETSWDIVDLQGNVVASQGGFNTSNEYYYQINCLKKGQCYKFRLHDSGQDGMNGFVQIETAEDLGLINAYFGGNFGELLEIPFCAAAPCAGFTLTVDVVPASTSGVADGQITVHTVGGGGGFMYSLDGVTFQSSPVFTGVLPANYTVVVVDMNECVSQLSVTVTATVVTNEAIFLRQLTIFPNPTPNLVWVELPALGQEKTAVCVLYDPSGKSIQTFRMTRWDDRLRGMVSLEKYPAGVYTLKVSGLPEVYGARIVKE
jgi:hypothetical protein